MHLVETLRPLIIKDTGTLHQGLFVLDKESWIGGVHLWMQSGVHPNGVNRARLNTVPAVNTEQGVDLVTLWKLLHVWIFVLTRLNVDTSSGARRRAQEAGGALHVAVIIEGKTVTSAIPGWVGPTLVRILDGYAWTFFKFHPKELQRVEPQILEQLTVGDGETFEDLKMILN